MVPRSRSYGRRIKTIGPCGQAVMPAALGLMNTHSAGHHSPRVDADPSRVRRARYLAPQTPVLTSAAVRPDAANADDHGVQEHTADDPDGIRAAHLARARRRRQSAPDWRPEPDANLCDDVIQQLYAIGLAMRSTALRCADRPKVAARIAGHLNDMQGVIHQIRSTVLDPRPSGADNPAAEPRIPAPHRS